MNMVATTQRLFTDTLAACQPGLAGSLIKVLLLMQLLLFSTHAWSQHSNYLLGPGDLISIKVYEEVDLSFDAMSIGDTGLITYPFLGEITVAGQTTAQLERQIREGLVAGEFLINPAVTVSIAGYRPFYINGEIAQPGSYPFEPGLTLRKAISIAGGFTERANRNRITIYSVEPGLDGTDANPVPTQADNLDVVINPSDIITIDKRFF